MQTLLANRFTNIVELKKNTSKVINSVELEPVAVLSHNTTKAYILSAKLYEDILEALDDKYLVRVCSERLKNLDSAIEVNLDEL
ncbi:MAG: type II toxin-antitoxin system Phd/YefM family antitoxin [Lentisphaerota bacterium]